MLAAVSAQSFFKGIRQQNAVQVRNMATLKDSKKLLKFCILLTHN